MRYYISYVLLVTWKEWCEGKLPAGGEKQGLWYHLHTFLGLFTMFLWVISKTLLSIMEQGRAALLEMGGFSKVTLIDDNNAPGLCNPEIALQKLLSILWFLSWNAWLTHRRDENHEIVPL